MWHIKERKKLIISPIFLASSKGRMEVIFVEMAKTSRETFEGEVLSLFKVLSFGSLWK